MQTALKPSYLLCFLSGALLMLGFTMLRRANAQVPQHVFELRLYNVNEGKMDALIARFGNHTDAIFKRHNMKSIGYWLPEACRTGKAREAFFCPEDAPSSRNLFVYILDHPSRKEAENNWAAFQVDPEWQKVKAESEVNGPLVEACLERARLIIVDEPKMSQLPSDTKQDVTLL